MIFVARAGNVNTPYPYATAPNVNTQKHRHLCTFYISYSYALSILLRHEILGACERHILDIEYT
jgi:hypothetical protein